MKPRVVTIGVYGFEKESFFQALQNAQVDLFCDIRLRRGMRGSKYAFVNSEQLQQRLRELNISYLHVKSLAPSFACSMVDATRWYRKTLLLAAIGLVYVNQSV